MPEKCGLGVQEKRDLGFLKMTESGSGCESKAADHQRTPRNFQREISPGKTLLKLCNDCRKPALKRTEQSNDKKKVFTSTMIKIL